MNLWKIVIKDNKNEIKYENGKYFKRETEFSAAACPESVSHLNSGQEDSQGSNQYYTLD